MFLPKRKLFTLYLSLSSSSAPIRRIYGISPSSVMSSNGFPRSLSSKMPNWDQRRSAPISHGCPRLKQWIKWSSEASKATVKAHDLNDFTITPYERLYHANKIHFNTSLRGGGRIFPASVCWRLPFRRQLSNSSRCIAIWMFYSNLGQGLGYIWCNPLVP